MKRAFSRIGRNLSVYLLTANLAAVLLAAGAGVVIAFTGRGEELLSSSNFQWALSSISMFVVAFPIYLAMSGRKPAVEGIEKSRLSMKSLGLLLVMMMGITYIFNGIGFGINYALAELLGKNVEAMVPIVNTTETASLLLTFFMACFVAPFFEEIIFRKIIIDRTRMYGERTAVLVSAVCFGLFHGNISQFLYAAAAGIVLGYIYIKTSDIRYTMGFHFAMNLVGGILLPKVVELDFWWARTAGMVIMLGLMILAVIILKCNYKKGILRDEVTAELSPKEMKMGKKAAFCNAGMIVYIGIAIFLMVFTVAMA